VEAKLKRTIRVGTRSSELALVQAEEVIKAMKALRHDFEFETVTITTRGDIMHDKFVSNIGGKGIFVREIENALLNGKIDIAVHSLKDMPSEVPEGLKLFPVMKREDPRDALVSKGRTRFLNLRKGARIGTSSLRRQMQLKDIRPDIEVVPIRGNIKTRLKQLANLDLDGIVLAAAGLCRLGLEKVIIERFSPEAVIPASCQGILAVEVAESFCKIFKEFYTHISDTKTTLEAHAERKLLRIFGADCRQPFGAYARYEDDRRMTLMIVYQKEGMLSRQTITIPAGEVDQAAEEIMSNAGDMK